MPGAHTLHPTILREYDIRGLVGETLSAPDAHAVGRAFASLAVKKFGGAPKICVAYDGRLSSPESEAALVDGLTKAGANVVRIGRGPTPLLYYAAHILNADGGVMITGSHNPPEYNGIKLVLGGDSLDLLQKSVREIQFPQPIENKQFLIYRVLFLFNGLAFSTSCLPTFATGLLKLQ